MALDGILATVFDMDLLRDDKKLYKDWYLFYYRDI